MVSHVAGKFYALQLAAHAAWACVVMWLSTRRHLHELSPASVVARPPWLPARALLALLRHRRSAFYALPAALAVGALFPDTVAVRIAVALAVTSYHLAESCASGRHGEYPLLYCAWAMLLPSAYSSAASLGVAVHFVLSAGAAKLRVGGARWADAGTMETYLGVYRASRTAPPLSRSLSHALGSRPWAARALGAGTLALELVLMPGLVLAPPSLRWLGWAAMLCLHAGILISMSALVGLVFLTTMPAYVLGFGCDAQVGSAPWALTACLAFGPTALSAAARRPPPEAWPCSAFALFMWNGAQVCARPQPRAPTHTPHPTLHTQHFESHTPRPIPTLATRRPNSPRRQ